MSSLRSIQIALFDLDGTLIETHIDFPAMRRAMQILAVEAGVSETAFDGRDILGMVEVAREVVANNGGDGEEYRGRAFGLLEEMEVVGCAHPNLLPGTVEWLSELREKGVRIGVVTRNSRRVSEGLLERFHVPHDLLLTRDDVRKTKPDPSHLLEAIEKLGGTPSEAIMVGDHWMDVQAGKAAGVAFTIGILGNRATDWFIPCPPDYIVRDLAEAQQMFDGPINDPASRASVPTDAE